MRTNLKVFRVAHKKKQADMAKLIGVTRVNYSAVERGEREGKLAFWNGLQQAFNIPDSEMWELQKLDEREEQCGTSEK